MDFYQIYSSVREKTSFKVFQCTVTECKVQLLSARINFLSDCPFIRWHLHCWFLPCFSEDMKICSCSSPCSVFIDYFDVQNKSHYAADQRGQFLSPKQYNKPINILKFFLNNLMQRISPQYICCELVGLQVSSFLKLSWPKIGLKYNFIVKNCAFMVWMFWE